MAEMFQDLFSLHGVFTLLMLLFLQTVLGFDNLLYIAIESKRVAEDQQAQVRKTGILLAIVFRIVLLLVILLAIQYLQAPVFAIPFTGYCTGDFNFHAIIVLAGGVFIVYTAIKEIFHMISLPDLHHRQDEKPRRSRGAAIFWIVLMNLVFSFDSILSAIALTKNWIVMGLAIVIGGVMMVLVADRVSDFLKKNRMYEVLGLFILLLVGIMLLGEGGHLAHLTFWNHPVEPMAKSTFYFVLGVMVIVDLAQNRYQKRLLAEQSEMARS